MSAEQIKGHKDGETKLPPRNVQEGTLARPDDWCRVDIEKRIRDDAKGLAQGDGTVSRWNIFKSLPLPESFILWPPQSPPKGVSAEREMIH